MRHLFLLVPLFVLICGCAQAHRHIGSPVVVSGVTGLHEGACPPRRAAQVASVIQNILVDNSSALGPCTCMPETMQAIVEQERRLDRVNHREVAGKRVPTDNVDIIRLAKPATVSKNEWMPKPLVLETLLVSRIYKNPYSGITTIWMELPRTTAKGRLFDPMVVRRDPFGLDKGECS